MSQKSVAVVSVLAALVCGTFFYPTAPKKPAGLVASPAAVPALVPEPQPPVLDAKPQPVHPRLAAATAAARPATDFRQGLAGNPLP